MAVRRHANVVEINRIIENDPGLRVVAATQPEVAAMTDSGTGLTNLIRDINPWPPHHNFPGGTLAVSLKSLLTPVDGEDPSMLKTIVDNRVDRNRNELEHVVEAFVRPVLRTHRSVLTATASGSTTCTRRISPSKSAPR